MTSEEEEDFDIGEDLVGSVLGFGSDNCEVSKCECSVLEILPEFCSNVVVSGQQLSFICVGVPKFVIDENNWEISSVKYFSNRFTGEESLSNESLSSSRSGVLDGEKLCFE